jgi:cysteinyl-tRNA synthetase
MEDDENIISDETESMILKKIEERNEAKKNKDFAKADKIRDELFDQGIKLIDSREGTTYEIIEG